MRSAALAPLFAVLAVLTACEPGSGDGTSTTGAGGSNDGGGSSDGGGSGDGGDGAAAPSSSSTPSGPSSSAASSTSGGSGGDESTGGGGSGGGEIACPSEFECSDGTCVPYWFFCDGRDDCDDGQDESPDACGAFVDGVGVCDSGLSFGGEDPNEGYNLCAGAACCTEFNICTSGGTNVNACIDCFADEGGGLCDAAIECAAAACAGGGSVICDTAITYGDVELDQCLGESCCEPFQVCVAGGSDEEIEDCLDCLGSAEPDQLCADAVLCIEEECPPQSPAGICESGVTSTDESDDECLGEACCTEFDECTTDGTAVQDCLDCLDAGGGSLCDDAIACANAECP